MAKRAPSARTPASRPWTDVEIEQLVRAWDASDAAVFERLGPVIGVTFTLDQLAKLERRARLDRRMVMLALGDAMSSDHGIGLRDEQAFMSTDVCLAAVLDGTLYAVTGHTENKGDGPAQLWGWLKPWYRDLVKNRGKIDLWLAKKLLDRLELAITAQPPAPVAVDELRDLRVAIVAAPDDDAPRHVLADLLQQRGDAHGELIALQLGRPDRNGDRIDTLVAEHGERIAGAVHVHATRYEIRRGLVDEVTMSAPKFKAFGEKLFTEHPIRELVLRPLRTKALAVLAACPALRRVRALTLSHDPGTPVETELYSILVSPYLQSLETLTLSGLDAPDWSVAFAGFHASRLRSIAIRHGRFDLRTLIPLLANPTLPPVGLSLSALPRAWERPGDDLGIIAAAIGRSRISALSIKDGAILFDAAHWTGMFSFTGTIAGLQIDGARFDSDALDAITAAPNCKLRSLSLRHTMVDSAALDRFLMSPAAAYLERLVVTSGTQIRLPSLHTTLERLPSSYPLRYVGANITGPVIALGPRYVDALKFDHPEAIRRGW